MQEVTLKDINKLAVPAIFAGIAEPMISLADTAIIGHLSTEALGAVGLGSSLFLIIVWVLGQIKSATSAIVSQNYGAGKVSDIKNIDTSIHFRGDGYWCHVLYTHLPFSV